MLIIYMDYISKSNKQLSTVSLLCFSQQLEVCVALIPEIIPRSWHYVGSNHGNVILIIYIGNRWAVIDWQPLLCQLTLANMTQCWCWQWHSPKAVAKINGDIMSTIFIGDTLKRDRWLFFDSLISAKASVDTMMLMLIMSWSQCHSTSHHRDTIPIIYTGHTS